MTGFGEARGSGLGFDLTVDVRSVNNRHLKVTVRGSDPYPQLDADLEKIIRKFVRRGTLHVHVRMDRQSKPGDQRLNSAVLHSYLEQVRTVCEVAGLSPTDRAHLFTGVLSLPGVAVESTVSGGASEEEWPVVVQILEQALQRLDVARKEEGRAMSNELLLHHKHLTELRELTQRRLPTVMTEYRGRLLDRVRQAVADAGVTIEPEQLIREVALFAERTDVAEELHRLTAHLDQFAEIVRTGAEGAGRRLEFVTQEMGREVNTLGSKAGDVTISRLVVEMKATLEKIRELVQNVE